MKRIKNFFAALLMSGAMFMPALVPGIAAAQATGGGGDVIQGGVCAGADLQFSTSGNLATNCSDDVSGADEGINNLIRTIINVFSIIVGIIAVIMIIIGGLKYIMSGGNDGNVSSAKNTILYAVVGLIIVALAQLIVRFVLSKATSVNA